MPHKHASPLHRWFTAIKESRRFIVKLAATAILLTLVAFILLVVAVFLRFTSGKSMGIMLLISGVTVFLGILVSTLLYIGSGNNRFSSYLIGRINALFSRQRLIAAVFLLLNEIILAFILVLVIFNIKLVGPAYFGILPAFLLLFGLSVSSLINLICFQPGFHTLFHNLLTISLPNFILLLLWFTASFYLGWVLANSIYPSLLPVFGQYTNSMLLRSVVQGGFALLFVDLLTLLVSYFSAWLNWSGVIPAHQENRSSQYRGLFTRNLFLSLGITTLLFVVFLAVLTPSFDIHDDLLIATMLSGYYGVEAIPFPVFSNVLLGILYKPLFSLNPQINWPVCFCYLVNFLAIWLLLFTILSTITKRLYKIFAGLLLMLFSSYSLINVTYTTAAANAALAGGCLIFSQVIDQSNHKVFSSIAGSLLLLLSSLLRFDGMLMVLGVLAPVILFNIRRVKFRKLLWSYLPVMVLIGGGFLFHHVYVTRDPGLRAYQGLLDLRIEIRDTPRLLHLRDKILPLYYHGFSTNDAEAFLLSVYIDDQVFSAGNLQKLIDITPNVRQDRKEIREYIITVTNQSYVMPFIALAVAGFLGFILAARCRKPLYSSLLAAAVVLLFLVYLFVWHKIPARVINPLLMSFTMITLLSLPWFTAHPEFNAQPYMDRFTSKLGAVVLLIVFVFSAWSIAGQTLTRSAQAVRDQAMVAGINHKLDQLQASGTISPQALIFPLGGQYYVDRMSPFTLDYPQPKLLMLDWQTSSPVISAFMHEYNILTPGRALYEDPHVYVIGEAGIANLLKIFIHQHYGVDVVASSPIDLCDAPTDIGTNCDYVLFQLIEQ